MLLKMKWWLAMTIEAIDYMEDIQRAETLVAIADLAMAFKKISTSEDKLKREFELLAYRALQEATKLAAPTPPLNITDELDKP